MAERRRVLLISQWLESGGTERQLTEIAKALDRSRFDPRVGCLRMEGPRLQDLREAGVPVVEFALRGLFRMAHLRAARALGRYLEEERIDIVHAFDVPGTLFAVAPARWYRAPLVLSSQRAFRELTPKSQWPLLRMTDRMVDGIVVNSEAVGKALVERDGVKAGRIHLCRNGLELSVYYPPEERRGGEVLTIGVAAMLRPEKSLHTLIEGFALVRAKGVAARLTIVGSGEMLESLETLARRLGVAEDCHFEPASRAVADWLRRFDIFVLPSVSEASSNSLMEAMACGCCVVASRVGGNPELVEEGVSGMLFEAGNAEDLAARLETLVGNREMRERMAEAGARKMRQEYSMAASARRMGEIYDSLPAKR